MPERDELERHAHAAVRRYDMLLLQDLNVHGVGVGEKVVNGEHTGEPCVTVFVFRKLPTASVPESVRVPTVLDATGIPVRTDIVEAGPAYMHPNSARIRPAQPGTSIGPANTTGTFGAVVTDDLTGESLILSNNHVLANFNSNPIGTPILQPGPVVDGGTYPADQIALLLRYIPLLTTSTNYVDAALARPVSPQMISALPLNGVPAPSPAVPAVGLIFGGDTVSRTYLNPIQTVLAMLGVSLPNGAVLNATVGMSLQKTGRTTERTEGTVQTVNTTVQIGGAPGTFTFVNQIVTTLMDQPGDSGSLAVLNP